MRLRIDLKIFIFGILFYFTRQIELYAIIMLFAIIHELGHLLVGILLGMKPEKIEIMPYGIAIEFKINIAEYNKKIKKGTLIDIKKILIALAGPLTNFIMILICYNKPICVYSNFLILAFNMMPIYPLDGGRILKSTLHIFFGKRKSEYYINKISINALKIITIVASIFILYIHNIGIILILFYLWGIVIKQNKIYKQREEIYKKILENTTI